MIFSGAALLVLLIYIPTALVFAMKRSNNHFTHAGGEIAYVVVQLTCWIGELSQPTPSHSQFKTIPLVPLYTSEDGIALYI